MRGGDTVEEGRRVEDRLFRDVMGRFATGVTVVTTRDGERRPVGATVSSFTSLSLDPPLVLICLENRSRTLGHIRRAGIFAVNVLAVGQQELSRRFAGPCPEWDGLKTVASSTGAPLLAGAVATVECRFETHYPGGDHHILIGRVVDLRADGEAAPLVYYKGAYGGFSPLR